MPFVVGCCVPSRVSASGPFVFAQVTEVFRPAGVFAGPRGSIRVVIISAMSVYVPNQREIAHEERLLADRAWQAERSALNDLLRRLDGARDDDAFFDVHVSLVARLKKRQELIADLRIRLASLKATRRELARSRPKPIADLKAIQLEIDEVDWDEEVQRNLHRLLLDVGDALVWRRLGFDRAAITVLGQGSGASYGRRTELDGTPR